MDELATAIRAEVNAGMFARITERMGPEARQRLQALLTVAVPRGTSVFNRLIGTDPNRCADGCGRSTSWAVAGLAAGC